MKRNQKKSANPEILILDPDSDELQKEKKEDLKRRKARGDGAYLEDLESKPNRFNGTLTLTHNEEGEKGDSAQIRKEKKQKENTNRVQPNPNPRSSFRMNKRKENREK